MNVPTLTPNQECLCEYDGKFAASVLLLLIGDHSHQAAYPTEEQRQAAAIHVMESFCDSFADALADAMEQGNVGEQRVKDVFTAIIQRRGELIANIAKAMRP